MSEPWYDRGSPRRSPSALLGAFRELLPFVRPRLASVVAALALLLLLTALSLVPPRLLGLLYDQVFPPEGARAAPPRGIPLPAQPWLALLAIAAATAVCQVVGAGLARVRQRVLGRAEAGLVVDLRDALFRRVVRLPGRDLLLAPPGQLAAHLLGDVDALEGLLSQWAETFFVAPIAFLGTLAVLLLLHARLAGVALLPIPFIVLVVVGRVRALRGLVEREREAAAQLTERSETLLGSLLLARTYAREDAAAAAFREAARAAREARLVGEETTTGLHALLALLATLGGTGVLLVGGAWALDARVTTGILLAFLNYSATLYPPLVDMSRANYVLQNVAVAMSRLGRILHAPQVEPPRAAGARPPEGPPALSLAGVRFAYEPGKEVLRAVDLEVPAGARVAIHGPSGGGKSTLARVIAGLLPPDGGTVLVGGTPPSLGTCAIVTQEEMLPGATVEEVLRYAREDATEGELRDALATAALDVDLRARIGPRGWACSGGERQRLAIARALVARPSLLILDEATSAVDAETEAAIHQALSRVLRDCTLILITHRTASTGWVDRRYRLDQGVLSPLEDRA